MTRYSSKPIWLRVPASTVGHDSHDLIVVGCSDEDVHHAAREIERFQGDLVAMAGGRVLAELPMPVAGLMSDRPPRNDAP